MLNVDPSMNNVQEEEREVEKKIEVAIFDHQILASSLRRFGLSQVKALTF